ncbi:MAG: AraC family transcriptional regulator ligand-binding domain-containing protein, partial [Pseudomonadales bacterium]
LLLSAQHQRLDIDALLTQLCVDPSQLDTPGKRYPVSTLVTLLDQLCDLSGNPAFALKAAEAVQPRMLGNLGFAMSTASTFFAACQTLADYCALAFEGLRIHLESRGEQGVISLNFEQNSPNLVAFFIACICNWSRWLTGNQLPAICVELTCQDSQARIFNQLLAGELHFDCTHNQIAFATRYLSTPCLEANAEMHRLHCQFADTLLLQSAQHSAVISQAKVQIRQHIEQREHDPTPVRREDIARGLNMSLRTFQRKLHSVHSNFQDLYDQVRHESCLNLLADHDLSLGQISYRLGFANPSAFQKAFKRWTGVTASEHRKRLLQLQDKHVERGKLEVGRWHSELQGSALEAAITRKLDTLSSFNLELMHWLACLAKEHVCASLQLLSHVSGYSIARLSIYLWPAQQQQLISLQEGEASGDTQIQLHPATLSDTLLCGHNPQQLSARHFTIALSLLKQNQLSPGLNHLKHCPLAQLESLQRHQLSEQLRRFHTQHETREPLLQSQLLSVLIALSDLSDEPPRATHLRLELLALASALNHRESCEALLSWLDMRPLQLSQQVHLAIYRAQHFKNTRQFERALDSLLKAITDCGFQEIEDTPNSASQHIAQQIEHLENAPLLIDEHTENTPTPLMQLLQQLTLSALEVHRPLIAAVAICRLLDSLVETPHSGLNAFAHSHFSWMCSWFGGNSNAAHLAAHRASLASRDQDTQLYLACQQVLHTRVLHWFTPLGDIAAKYHSALAAVDDASTPPQLTTLQLALCSGASISTIYADSLIQIAHYKKAETPLELRALRDCCRALSEGAELETTQAFYKLFHRFYTLEEAQWPALFPLAEHVEHNAPSHFITTEASFISVIMQIYSATQPIAPLTARRIEAALARFEMWAQQSPENFSAPSALATAAYSASTKPLNIAMQHFEHALSELHTRGHLHHHMIGHFCYAKLLAAEYPQLSALCLSRAHELQKTWLGESTAITIDSHSNR